MYLTKYKKNVYSQNGEDGIIEEIINKINSKSINNLWCCEFGAWDGKHSSNTFSLVEKYNSNAVYIESNKNKYKQLLKTVEKFPKIIPFNLFVEKSESSLNSLDNILKKTNIPNDFDVLSIDIDSCDLDVWDSLKNYLPKIVIIEINSSILPGKLSKHGSENQGNSFTSTVNVAKNKGYELVCHVGNCIFVRKDLLHFLKIDNKFIENPELLFEKKWLNKKNNFLKKILIMFVPEFLLNYLRKLK